MTGLRRDVGSTQDRAMLFGVTKLGKTRVVIIAAALSLMAAACGADPVLDAGSAGGGSDAGGDETTTSTTAAEETTTTAEETTTTTAGSEINPDYAGQAPAFRSLLTIIDDLDPAVITFFEQASDDRIDQLGSEACAQISPDQTTNELGAVALKAYSELPADEKAQLDVGQFATAYGTLAGFYCPENLNLDDDDGSTAMPDPADLEYDIQAYRDNLTSFLDPGHQAIGFVDNASDVRLDELVAVACGNASPDQSTQDLGFDVIDVYGNELTDDEQALIDVNSFAELYGTFLGWFCADSIPLG